MKKNTTDDDLNAVLDGYRVDLGSARLLRVQGAILTRIDARAEDDGHDDGALLFGPMDWRQGLGACSAVGVVTALVLLIAGAPANVAPTGLQALLGASSMMAGGF